MKERELAAACATWLRGRGFEVYGEVKPKAWGRTFDLVGLNGDEVWIVETKTSFSRDVRRQAQSAAAWADVVLVGIPARRLHLPPRGRFDTFGVLYVAEDGSVSLAQTPDLGIGRYASVTRAACTPWHRDHPGGVTSRERAGAPTPFQTRVWRTHLALYPRKAGLRFGELFDLVGGLFQTFHEPRSALARMLRASRAFALSDPKHPTRSVITATGLDVPASCCPGAPPIPVRWRSTDPDGTPFEWTRKPENDEAVEIAWRLPDGRIVTERPA